MMSADPRIPAADPAALRSLLDGDTLAMHLQPIVELSDGTVHAHEALVRPPVDCPWRNPDELFAAARACGMTSELEIACLRLALRSWSRIGAPGRLFVNLSASALVTVIARRDLETLVAAMAAARMRPEAVVVELTEHEHVRDHDAVQAAVERLRRHRIGIALDDFGDGRSSLRLWSQLKPEYVKIDKYFSHQVHATPDRIQTLRALTQISATMGSTLVAEGIESADDLLVVRDLGIRLGQGWLIGRPRPQPFEAPMAEALAAIRSKVVAVFPERRRTPQQRASARTLLTEVPPISPECTNAELFEHFQRDDALSAVAVVEEGRPVGLIGRQRFVDRYARPYFRELYGRRPCLLFANLAPHLVDVHAGIEELSAVLTSEDQRYLAEGVIVVEGGRYRGLASGEALVRSVTESRIEAARHANPLTLLPGNIPLTQHIERLVASGREFVACYGDLNHFKPFNDLYGYWRGDEMILRAAQALAEQADPRRDFVGHVGGDDFVVLFQSDDWEQRCLVAIERFNAGAVELYDDAARSAGGVQAEDRHGVPRFHPLTTLSIGAVPVGCGTTHRPEDIASAAARAKREAKARSVGLMVLADALPRAAGRGLVDA